MRLREKDEFRKRIGYYGDCLRTLPEYKAAIDKCISFQKNISEEEKLFLNIYAPVITMYARWILSEAFKNGIKRVYFLARDARPVYMAATALERSVHTGIDIRYLKVSRYALRRAEYMLPDTDKAGLICSGAMNVTFRNVMDRGGLDKEEAERLAELTGYKGKEDKKLKYPELRELSECLKKNEYFEKYVTAHSVKAYENTMGYLIQEGLADDIPYGIADSGWLGTMQKSIGHLIDYSMGNHKKITGYYFGLYELPGSVNPGDYRCFYFRPYKDIRRKVFFDVCLFETICSSKDGMTVGYKELPDGGFAAVESSNGNPNEELIEKHEDLLGQYLDCMELADGLRLSKERTDAAVSVIYKIFSQHMGRPTAVEANIYGSLKFCDDVTENSFSNLASRWGRKELRNNNLVIKILIKSGMIKRDASESGWPEGSIVNAGIQISRMLLNERIYRWLMYIRKAAFSRGK